MTLREAVARAIGYHFAALVSRNNQPVMSGDPRDRLLPHVRRVFDDCCREAADAAIAAYEAAQWRDVKSDPPPKGEPLFLAWPDGMMQTGQWSYLYECEAYQSNLVPTHWRPLPAPPESQP